jgi:hypothetical protein
VEPVDWAAMRVRRWFEVRRDSMMSVGFSCMLQVYNPFI